MIKYRAPETLALCCGDPIGFIGKVSQLLRSASSARHHKARRPARGSVLHECVLMTKRDATPCSSAAVIRFAAMAIATKVAVPSVREQAARQAATQWTFDHHYRQLPIWHLHNLNDFN